MSWNKVLPAIRHLGYCCPFAFFKANQELSSEAIADLLCVEPRTIRYQLARFRQNKILCTKTTSCFKVIQFPPQEKLPPQERPDPQDG